MNCPNCKSGVNEDDLILSVLTDSLLCCPNCKGKGNHFAVIGTDPGLVFNEADKKSIKIEKENK